MAIRLVQYFTEIDIFGAPISLQYRGRDTYKTRVGALLSLATYTIVIVVLLQKCVELMDGSAQEEVVKEVRVNMYDDAYPYELNKLNFTFFLNSGQVLPPEIGRWRAYYVFTKGSEELNITDCREQIDWIVQFWKDKDVKAIWIERYMEKSVCVNYDQITLIGSESGDIDYQGLRVEFEHCRLSPDENIRQNCLSEEETYQFWEQEKVDFDIFSS